MSEYQHYEFLAVDQPLGRNEQQKVREYSTRARITSTVFENEYHWGAFKGNPVKFLQNWYDVLVYVANWGTHRIGLGLPAVAVDLDLARRCCGKHVDLKVAKGRVIVDVVANLEEPPDYDGAELGMAELSGVRATVLQGDTRFWYLCWLLGVQEGWLKDKEMEPVVPVGLGQLNGALRTLAEFLYIDANLVEAAANGTGRVATAPRADIRQFIKGLGEPEKNALLMRAAKGDISAELVRRVGSRQGDVATRTPRTAGQLRREAQI